VRRLLRWTGWLLGVLVLAVVLVLAGFRVAAARRETSSRHDAAPKTGRFVKAADVELTGAWPVRAVLGVPPLRDAVVAATLSSPRMTGWLLSKLVSNREAAVTPERIAMPALVIWGARDSLTPMPQGEDLVRLVRGARWELLPRAGHIPAIEDEPSFDAALLDFLREP
jgi:pimeloyl-ACP methyl ester carboxylesterase